jgi:hypothetical protein
MVNSDGGSGQAPMILHSAVRTEHHSMVVSADGDEDLVVMEVVDAVPAAPCAYYDERYLDCRDMPGPWSGVLGAAAARLWVNGDGTCASGSLNVALLGTPGSVGTSMEECRAPTAVAQFKQRVVQLVQSWTDDEWCARVGGALRDEVWEADVRGSYAGCTSCSVSESGLHCLCRTAAAERAVFCGRCSERSYHMPPVFFHVLAVAMQVGVMLIVDDLRLCDDDSSRKEVYSYGTTEYPCSVVICGTWVTFRGGHYEAVGMGASDKHGAASPLRTPRYRRMRFAPNDPLLVHIRQHALENSLDETPARHQISFVDHAAVLLGSGDNGCLAHACPSPAGGRLGDTDDLRLVHQPLSTSAGAASGHASARSLRRRPTLSWRLRDAQEGAAAALADSASKRSQRQPRAVQRSLAKQLDAVETDAAGEQTLHSIGRSASSPDHVAVPRRVQLQAPASLANAAVRPSASAGPTTVTRAEQPHQLAALVARNVQSWVRSNARRGRLVSRVHIAAVPMWTLRCRTILLRLSSALRAEPMDERLVLGCLCAFWVLPMAVFTVPSRTGGGAAGRRRRIRRVHYHLNDERLVDEIMAAVLDTGREQEPQHVAADTKKGWPQPDPWLTLSEVMSAAGRPPAPRASSHCATDSTDSEPESSGASYSEGRNTSESVASDCDNDGAHVGAEGTRVRLQDGKMARRTERMFALGDSSRAMQALSSTTTMADLNVQQERDLLRALHPPVAGSSGMPSCPDTPEISVSYAWMRDAMRSSDTGAASGPSGFGSNFLAVLATDVQCVHAMALLIQRVVNNTLPSAVRTVLTTCIVVSLGKDDGGRRPLAIGDMFYRLASKYALSLVSHQAQAVLSPHQFGVGHPDGCTQVVQSVQHLLTCTPGHASQPLLLREWRPNACLSVDVKNAFNTVDRAVMLRAMYALPQLRACWRMVAFGYGQPSLLLMQCDDSVDGDEAVMESQTGVRQGDPLAALLFSVAMHGVYEVVAGTVSGGCLAFVDDNHAVGTLEECWAAWTTVQEVLQPLGLGVNAAKCELTCFHQDGLNNAGDRAALAAFHAAGMRVNNEAVSILGCVVARNDQAISNALLTDPKHSDVHAAAFRRLPLLKRQSAMLALQRLDGVVLTNRLRAMPPSATAGHAAMYDAQVVAAARRLTGVTVAAGAAYDEQLCSPLAHGGFGLASAVRLAPAAYLAGVESTLRCSPVFAAMWAEPDTAVPLLSAGRLCASIDDSLHRIAATQTTLSARCEPAMVNNVSRLGLPDSAATFVQHFRCALPCPIQHSITHRITTLSFIARVCEARKEGKEGVATVARLLALKEPASSLWLQVLPTHPGLTMTDAKWLWAARLRLGMPAPVVSSQCDACKAPNIYTTDSWHALTCVSRSGALITRRHNSVLDVVAKYCKLIDVAVTINPAGESDVDERRADIEVYLPDRTIVGDVTVSHPSTKTWRNKVAKSGVHVVGDAREAAKTSKYQAMAAQHDKQFHAIVLYTYGGLHSSAKTFLAAICDALDPALCLLSYAEFKAELHAHIAIAVQRGNAAIMIEDSVQARMRDAPLTRRRYAAARRAALRAAAAGDNAGRGVRQDGAQLMRGARPACRVVRGAAGDRVVAGDSVAAADSGDMAAPATHAGMDSCEVAVCAAAADLEMLSDDADVVGECVPRVRRGGVASGMGAMSGAADACAGVMLGVGGGGGAEGGAGGGCDGDTAAGSRAGAVAGAGDGGEAVVALVACSTRLGERECMALVT